MTSGKKVLFLLFMTSVIVLLSIFYLETRARSQVATDEGLHSSNSEASDTSLLRDDSPPAKSYNVEREVNTQSELSAGQEQAISQPEDDSPFAIVVDELGEIGEERDVSVGAELFENRQSEAAGDNTLPNSNGQDKTQSAPVVVPESYPISEASRYFVPKEDRRPGNLGGPPPLSFPGGPNDTAEPGTGKDLLPPPVPQ